MRHFLLALALALASVGLAQAPDKETAPQDKVKRANLGSQVPDPEELAVERAAAERMGEQVDDWFHDGDYPAIINSLRLQTEMWPWDEDTATSLGWMLGNIRQPDAEIAEYMRYMRRNPENPDGPFGAAKFYLINRNFVMVVHLLEPTVRMSRPPHPNNFRMLANSYQRLGLLKPSFETWEKYLKLAPKDLAAVRNRNRVAVLLGLPEIASPV